MSDKTPDATPTPARPSASDGGPLTAIDAIVATWSDRERRSAEEHEESVEHRSTFSTEFTRRIDTEVRPAMQAIIERLRSGGGGGVVVERPEESSRHYAHRFTLWMSIEGEIEDTPRQDRYPYLELDADVDSERVEVFEGDLWRGRPGGSSGKGGEWTLEEMDGDRINEKAIAILRRAVG